MRIYHKKIAFCSSYSKTTSSQAPVTCLTTHRRRRRDREATAPPVWKLFGQIWTYPGKFENEDLFLEITLNL